MSLGDAPYPLTTGRNSLRLRSNDLPGGKSTTKEGKEPEFSSSCKNAGSSRKDFDAPPLEASNEPNQYAKGVDSDDDLS